MTNRFVYGIIYTEQEERPLGELKGRVVMRGFVMVFDDGEILTYPLRGEDAPRGWTIQSALRALRSFRRRGNYYHAPIIKAGICPDFARDVELWNEINWVWEKD